MILWIVAHQAPLSMEFSRQEYWSGLSFPPAGDVPNSGAYFVHSASPVLAGRLLLLLLLLLLASEPPGKPDSKSTTP